MPKSNSSSSKKKEKRIKKRKQSQAEESLSNVCNVAGLDTGGGGFGNDVMDCLDEMATAQVVGTAVVSTDNGAASGSREVDTKPAPTKASTPPPPGIHQIPNIRIELARHLHTQTLSTFLLQSIPGIRMPTFERWLLDSKLEESDRFECIIQEWIDNPSEKLDSTSGKSKKKKYGRAAEYSQKQKRQKEEGGDAREEREKSRREKDYKLLLSAEKLLPVAQQQAITQQNVGNWISHVERDPILPYLVLETDPSCDRLSKEIVAHFLSTTNNSNEELEDAQQPSKRSGEIIRELCHRTTEACRELQHLEQRLGKYHKFPWDSSSSSYSSMASSSKKKKRKQSGSGSAGGNVHVEWHKEDGTCSLIFVHKKRKSTSSSSAAAASADGEADEGDTLTGRNKSKPFVIKINESHYHKLRAMFDATYNHLSDATFSVQSMTKEQSSLAFHTILFAMVIRYSSLSGGQLLNDFRGGGMQGAVHEGVFDCLSKWFGQSDSIVGTECFASPFNSTMTRFFSAFPSPDVDGHFGSCSDFFQSSLGLDFLESGWYELNPPFSPGIMSKMAHRLGKLLNVAVDRELDVTFIVVIPTVLNDKSITSNNTTKSTEKKKKKGRKHSTDNEDTNKESNDAANLMSTVHNAASNSFRQLINSQYCRSHIVLAPREHGYIEGGQHLRPTKYKDSQYSTSVIVMRSKDWACKGDSAKFEKDLREAFVSRHADEVEQRKHSSS